jgi:glutaminyl-tRNA synthetase
MPTISGMRRRGVTAEALRTFSLRIGVSKNNTVVDIGMLEHAMREDLNARCPRVMGVLDPVKLVITNYPEGQEDVFECPYHPEDPSFGRRSVPFSRELWIEREDFAEVPHKKWHRLAPGQEVRLRYAALVTCTEVVKDDVGNITELRCTWDPESKGGAAKDGRRVKGTIHWVSAAHAIDAEVRLYDRLYTDEDPTAHEDKTFLDFLDPASEEIRAGVKLEPSLASLKPGERVQLERVGYFVADSEDHRPDSPVLNRTITLKDTWAKLAER